MTKWLSNNDILRCSWLAHFPYNYHNFHKCPIHKSKNLLPNTTILTLMLKGLPSKQVMTSAIKNQNGSKKNCFNHHFSVFFEAKALHNGYVCQTCQAELSALKTCGPTIPKDHRLPRWNEINQIMFWILQNLDHHRVLSSSSTWLWAVTKNGHFLESQVTPTKSRK